MSKLIHAGVRPLGKIEREDGGKKRNTYYEDLEDGGYRIWNDKLLNSGCGRTVDGEGSEVSEDISLLWCPHCREWANKNQFISE